MTVDVVRTFILHKMDECDELMARPDLTCPDPEPNAPGARRSSRMLAIAWPGLALLNSMR